MIKNALVRPSLRYFLQFCVPDQLFYISGGWLRCSDPARLLALGNSAPGADPGQTPGGGNRANTLHHKPTATPTYPADSGQPPGVENTDNKNKANTIPPADPGQTPGVELSTANTLHHKPTVTPTYPADSGQPSGVENTDNKNKANAIPPVDPGQTPGVGNRANTLHPKPTAYPKDQTPSQTGPADSGQTSGVEITDNKNQLERKLECLTMV